MSNKYSAQPLPVSPRSIIARHYGTHSAKRATSIEEFNRDGEYMAKLTALYMRAQSECRKYPTEYRKSVADRILSFAKWKNAQLKEKHWPSSKILTHENHE